MMFKRSLQLSYIAACATALGGLSMAASSVAEEANSGHWPTIENYCFECHNAEDWAGGVAFDVFTAKDVVPEAETFEEAIRRLKGGHMPPPGSDRPPETEIQSLASWLENTIDSEASTPSAGHVPLRRLNRREYENAIRDLLALEIDASALLPADNLEHGFDTNAAALQVSPAFIDQYLNAARTVAHNAIGDRRPIPVLETYGSVADMIISLPARGTDGTGVQQNHQPGMPFGTRGGMSVLYNFMADGLYELNIGDLALGREVPNMEFKNTIVALLDGKEFFRTVLGGDEDHELIDQEQADGVSTINNRLKNIRFNATAGQHTITVTFLHRSFAESDERTPALALEGGQSRIHKLHALQIRGPLEVQGMSASKSRQRIFVCYPESEKQESACAERILHNLAQRAFRRPIEQEDLDPLVAFYENSRKTQDFEASIKEALSAVLVSPHFIYRAEVGAEEGSRIALSDFELATRLAFFLWSSLPDEELLTSASENKLHKPEVLKSQVERMLADERSKTLVNDFAAQWLHLSKLDEINPNGGMFRYASRFLDPRPMFKEELSLFIDSVLRSDQSVVRLLDADYTFLNERLAAHYGIENVKGSAFRKVTLEEEYRRGLLGKGAILMLTANPNRTSPVIRGAWVLERLLASPPPPPPDGVETDLVQNRGKPTTVRERLEQHRDNPGCYSCHGVLDPIGFALENFNTVGQFEAHDRDTLSLIDASGVLPDGTQIKRPEDLISALVGRSDQFVQSLTEHLMTYALGRNVNYRDMPTVRKIVKESEKDDYTFKSIVFNIVTSDAFRMSESMTSASDAASDKHAAL